MTQTKWFQLMLFIANSYSCFSQEVPKTEVTDRVILNKNDSICQFYTAKAPPRFKVNTDAEYTWYTQDTILITQGSFGGKLLHGSFKKFYPNHNLNEEGKYNYGQKDGAWKYWDPDGKLVEVITWKKGKKKHDAASAEKN
ncbi:MAG TPA: hypothetical protein VEB42_13290 [Chitinophagaceae bacterium]|nr:hypothetical protein [Chitinophagaceae bacterium]